MFPRSQHQKPLLMTSSSSQKWLCPGQSDYFSTTSLAIALKVSSSEGKIFFLFLESVQIFSMALSLQARGKLMLANFRLEFRAVGDSDIENRSSNLSHK